ncbi:MAG: exodeoxyribonuclease VII large subunit, partial [Ruminococcaceae bacterium]|nr:exodeoxyribonuclease VII large subunit [Oscillospiraceae bacterium]
MEYLTVTSLNRYVKIFLESNEELKGIKVIGEISNLSLNRFSGHLYFTLKDEKSGISAVCFKNSYDRLRFLPKNGMEVVIKGRVSLYERDGKFQIIADDMSVSGSGAQQKFREDVKRKLEMLGIFSLERKRKIPQFPKNIALITAKDSAAYSDIVNILKRRYPIAKLSVYPVLVQG